MHITHAFVSGLLAASAVLALPNSLPFHHAKRDGSSSNKAGAYFSKASNTFQDIDVTFVVPDVTGGVTTGDGVFISIDGVVCNSFVQVGVGLDIDRSGNVVYKGYSQFSPNLLDIYGLSISRGDEIELHISAFNTTAASVLIRNLSTGESEYDILFSYVPLCQSDAAWLVQAFDDPMDKFQQLTFSNAIAQGTGGAFIPSQGASTMDISGVTTTKIDGSNITITVG